MAVVVRVADDFVANATAQQLIDGHAEGLALDVPQGDVDGGDCGAQHALGREEAAAEEELPDVFDTKGVLSDEDLLKVLECADHGLFAAGQAGLSHAVDTLVGVNDDEEKVTMTGPDGIGGNVSYLHWLLLGLGVDARMPDLPETRSV